GWPGARLRSLWRQPARGAGPRPGSQDLGAVRRALQRQLRRRQRRGGGLAAPPADPQLRRAGRRDQPGHDYRRPSGDRATGGLTMTTADDLLLYAAEPTPESLRRLQTALLAVGIAEEDPVWSLLDSYYAFLTTLAARATSREFSHFASLLDMGAVGGVALQNLLHAEAEGQWWNRLLVGGLSEGLMVLAARQY